MRGSTIRNWESQQQLAMFGEECYPSHSAPWATKSIPKRSSKWPQKPNDLIMAFWLADIALRELIDDARHVDAEIMPGLDKWRTPWHDEQVYEIDLSVPFDQPAEYI